MVQGFSLIVYDFDRTRFRHWFYPFAEFVLIEAVCDDSECWALAQRHKPLGDLGKFAHRYLEVLKAFESNDTKEPRVVGNINEAQLLAKEKWSLDCVTEAFHLGHEVRFQQFGKRWSIILCQPNE